MPAILSCCLVVVAPLVAPVAVAEEESKPTETQANKDVLSAIPGDAWAVLSVRNLAELDRKIMTMSQQLGTPAMSLLQMAKGLLGLVAGFDDNGSAAVALMPTANIMMPMDGLVLLMPCADYAGLTAMMEPEDLGEGISKILFKGEESYVAEYGSYALISPTSEAVKKVLAAQGGKKLRGVWTPHQIDHFQDDDITLWVNADALIQDPTIQGMLMMPLAMSGGDPAAKLEQLKAYRSLNISLRFGEKGLGLGYYMDFKEGTKEAKSVTSTKPTKKTLLGGLPMDNYIIAAGMLSSKEGSGYMAEQIEAALSNPMLAAQTDPEKMKKVMGILTGMLGDLRAVSFSISGLPDGPKGLIGLAKVVTFENGAKQKLVQYADLIGTTVSMIPVPAEQEIRLADLVKYNAAAETIGGMEINHLVVHLDQIPDVQPEWLETVTRIVGKEGILVRIAAVDDQHVAATFGGGPERMEEVIGLVKGGRAPRGGDEATKKVAAMLPQERTFEGYLAVDQLLRAIAVIGKLVGESGMPQMPPVNAPVAMVGRPVGATGFQADVAFPMELIGAVKDVVMAGTGGPAGQTGASGSESRPEATPGSED
jgi:hypothetical protein